MTTATTNAKNQTAIAPQVDDELLDFDSFDSQQMADVSPFAQILNPIVSKGVVKPFGLGITEKNAEAIQFNPSSEWVLEEREFTTGKEMVWMSAKPRVLIIRQSELFLRNKLTKKVIGFGGKNYNSETEQNFTTAFLLILRNDNTLAHEIYVDEEGNKSATPLKISLVGVAGIKFSESFISKRYKKRPPKTTGLVVDIESAFAFKKYGKTVEVLQKEGIRTTKDSDFWAHCVYAPTFEYDEAGKPGKMSAIARVNSYEVPTPETLAKYFISPKTEVGQVVTTLYKKYKDYQPTISSVEEDYTKASTDDDGFSPRKAPPEVNPVDELGGFDETPGKIPF